jgi:hypothetical protein
VTDGADTRRISNHKISRSVAGVSRPFKPKGRFRFKLGKRGPPQIGKGAAKAAA